MILASVVDNLLLMGIVLSISTRGVHVTSSRTANSMTFMKIRTQRILALSLYPFYPFYHDSMPLKYHILTVRIFIRICEKKLVAMPSNVAVSLKFLGSLFSYILFLRTMSLEQEPEKF